MVLEQIFKFIFSVHGLLVVHTDGTVVHSLCIHKSSIELDAHQIVTKHGERNLIEFVGNKIVQIDQIDGAVHVRLLWLT